MSGNEIEAELSTLESMPLDALRVAWVRRVKTSPPKVSAGILRLALAHAIQAKAFGDVSKTVDRQLRELAQGDSRGAPAPGTRLARSWHGRMQVVTVTEEKRFHWQGRDWNSLSEVARAITGTRWSGPAFFGLKPRKRAA